MGRNVPTTAGRGAARGAVARGGFRGRGSLRGANLRGRGRPFMRGGAGAVPRSGQFSRVANNPIKERLAKLRFVFTALADLCKEIILRAP